MKITNTTLMVAFENDVKIGPNDSIELTIISNAFVSKDENGNTQVDMEIGVDYTKVKFLGKDVDNSYNAFKEFKESLKKLGIYFEDLVGGKEIEIANSGLEDKLKLMFRDNI
jgi:hypothetical protein